MTVRTRFAPSPTGVLHLGSIRTALFCWLFARHNNGKFILRIEDTDRERSRPENVDAIIQGLSWLTLDPDEGPYFQSHRYERYKVVLDQWLKEGKAYNCYCTRDELDDLRAHQMRLGERVRYDGRCRDRPKARPGVVPVVRFRNPDRGIVVVDDRVRGKVVFDNAQLDDLIIARSDGTPTYNFTVVVDDSEMRITDVIRGDDHLNNTPRQINMFKALGKEPPAFAHLPMILGPDGTKLSKRHGAVDIREYQSLGYLPEAMLNYLARLGWSSGDQEIFSIKELIRLFDLSDVNQSASSFNPEKLLWINQQHIMAAPVERLAQELQPFLISIGLDPNQGPEAAAVASAFHERADTLLQMAESARYCYEDFDAIEPNAAKKFLRPVILEPLIAARDRLASLSDWNRADIEEGVKATAESFAINLGKIGQPIRVAVTGGPVSPPIDVTLQLIGQSRTIERLNHAIELIEARMVKT